MDEILGVLQLAAVPIEEIEVGQRVYAGDDKSSYTDVDPDTWRKLTLSARNQWDNGTIDEFAIVCLVPPDWLERNLGRDGKVAPPVDLHEMSLPDDLRASVVADDPCPPIQDGPGQVVTMTVSHLNRTIADVTFIHEDGQSQTIGVTTPHRFFSLDRNDWLAIGDAKIGERFKTQSGTCSVSKIARRTSIDRVYNMTVEVDHLYYVSDSACNQWILTHNMYDAQNRGVFPVQENLGTPRNRAQAIARDFESGTVGAASDLASGTRQVPALQFDNPNPNGAGFVKFDGSQTLSDGTIELIDAKTRLVPFSTADGPFISPSVRVIAKHI